MTPIQFILVGISVLALIRTCKRFLQRRIAWNALLFWILVWGSITLIALNPDITSRLATMVGVGRGADLMLYIGMIILFSLVFYLMVKVDQLDQDISKIVTALALKDIKNDKQ